MYEAGRTEVEPVPGVAEVGVLVQDEAAGEDLEHHLPIECYRMQGSPCFESLRNGRLTKSLRNGQQLAVAESARREGPRAAFRGLSFHHQLIFPSSAWLCIIGLSSTHAR
jgi:hypothetical protein